MSDCDTVRAHRQIVAWAHHKRTGPEPPDYRVAQVSTAAAEWEQANPLDLDTDAHEALRWIARSTARESATRFAGTALPVLGALAALVAAYVSGVELWSLAMVGAVLVGTFTGWLLRWSMWALTRTPDYWMAEAYQSAASLNGYLRAATWRGLPDPEVTHE